MIDPAYQFVIGLVLFALAGEANLFFLSAAGFMLWLETLLPTKE